LTHRFPPGPPATASRLACPNALNPLILLREE
jgi:hypothetical protein